MQQFTVPQFIDVEDKIIGPITVRQFVILIAAGFFLFLEYKLSDFGFFIFIGIPTILVFATLAFVRINGMPFHYFMLNFIQTLKKPSIRIWTRSSEVRQGPAKTKKEAIAAPVTIHKATATRSRLSELSLVVDTGGVYREASSDEDFSFNQSSAE